MKRRCGGRNVNWRGAVDVASLALSRSQPPRRAAPRCFASRHDACVTSLRPKPCVDSHAFRDEGRFQLHTDGLAVSREQSEMSQVCHLSTTQEITATVAPVRVQDVADYGAPL